MFNKSEAEIKSAAQKINDTGIEYVCTGHCTKNRAYKILEKCLGGKLNRLRVGLVSEF